MSILGDTLRGAQVLDAFAGSGALGLEALSRGAAHVDFVEISGPSLAALRHNVASLGVDQSTTVHRADAVRFVARLLPGAYDVALADPPYTLNAAEDMVKQFREVPFARVLAVEHRSDVDPGGDDMRRYGDTAISFCYAP